MHKYLKILIAFATLLLAVPGCGGTEDTSPESTTGLAATTTPPTTIATTTTSTTLAPTTTSTVTTTSEHVEEPENEQHDEEADLILEVSMTDFAFEPGAYEIMAGETVKFVIANDGLIEHEFRISNEHRIEEHMASGHEDHDDGGHHEEGGDLFVIAQPGETVELVVTFPEDTSLYTEVACLLPGHYEAGMKAPITYLNG